VGWLICVADDAPFLGALNPLFCCVTLLRIACIRYWRGIDLRQIIEIAPSILAADFANLGCEIERVERGGADLIHVDVMDGHFVPNITIGPPAVASIRKVTRLPLDVHLMIEKPDRYIDDFVRAGANWISVHVEADIHLDRTLRYLKERGVKAGVAINPGGSLALLQEILPLADFILIMTVNPGFGGQKFIPSSLDKIRKLSELIASNKYNARIEIDGGIGPENLREVLMAGAEIIVAGSAIFDPRKDASEAVRELKGIAEQHLRDRSIH
jgi:ribulose-phosphate 3-epimerase